MLRKTVKESPRMKYLKGLNRPDPEAITKLNEMVALAGRFNADLKELQQKARASRLQTKIDAITSGKVQHSTNPRELTDWAANLERERAKK